MNGGQDRDWYCGCVCTRLVGSHPVHETAGQKDIEELVFAEVSLAGRVWSG